jgi:hypothetical protein
MERINPSSSAEVSLGYTVSSVEKVLHRNKRSANVSTFD